MNELERNELTEEYGLGPDLLATAVAEIPRRAWDFKPAPTEWSVRQLVAHMTDSETLAATRLYMILAQPGSTLMSYEDEAWTKVLSYPDRSIEDTLQLFRLLRQTVHPLLKTVPDSALSNSVIHPDRVYPEYGEAYNLEKWLRIYTRHVRDHVEQLHGIHAAWKKEQG